jgi:DnaK suppressor protein
VKDTTADETATAPAVETAVPKKPVVLEPAILKIRDRLLKERDELMSMIQSFRAQERTIGELNFSNEIDLASSLEGREMIFQLSSRDRNELKLIEDALYKIREGRYGMCESCGKRITMKRLQILPLTSLCIECQENLEHL